MYIILVLQERVSQKFLSVVVGMGILISWNAFLNKYDVVVYVLVTYKKIYKKMSIDIILPKIH